jgi:LmbE family N-acetylglucosaminyl deacetylase
MIMSHSRSWRFGSAAASCKIDGLLGKPVAPADFLRQALPLAEMANHRRQRNQRRILAIGAHPDDVEIGCAGSLARHRAKGDIVHILTLSRGGGGGDIGVRTAEAHNAAKILGASLTLGNIPDGHITEGMETIRIIKEVVDDLEPTHVYTHSFDDTHQDHRAAHAASVIAARTVPNLYCYDGASSTVAFVPNRFVEITDFLELKLRVLDAYGSQAGRVPALQPDNVIAAARHWGRFARYALVEPFRILRQVDQDAARPAPDLDDVPRALRETPLCASQSAAD